MLIRTLNIISFRNFKSASIDFDPGVNIFYGKNGAGKSNLLEAIFVLLLGRSPRGANDAVMVKENAGVYRLEGEIELGGTTHLLAVAYQTGGRKKITIDKVSVRAAELFERCTAVSAAPSDMEILSGPPSRRRDFVNIYLSQASAIYLSNLSDYHKALEQKNAFLKGDDNGKETPYDDLLVKYGSIIMLERKVFLEAVSSSAASLYDRISGGQKLQIHYNPSVHMEENDNDTETIESNFRGKLKRYGSRERILQTALVGPHRDEIEFNIGTYPARSHASQGELRTASVALKLAVFKYLKTIRRETPILLLDEIFAELDNTRKEKLIDSFDEFGQLFLTTAGVVPSALAEKGRKFKIHSGTVARE